MTVLDAPTAMSEADEAQLLFQEARDRRRRRWIRSGIIAATVVVLAALTLGIVLGSRGGGAANPAVPPGAAPVVAHPGVSLSFRPVLCEAPPLSLAAGQAPTGGPLPSCSPASQLTAANLDVNTLTGETTANPPPDAQFSSYASTPVGGAGAGGPVLLPGAPDQAAARFVLGPAAVTQQAVTSARAVEVDGQWAVDLTLSPTGSAAWDGLTQQQFHALIGVVVNGTVISTPITQPTQSGFSTFGGQVQLSGNFTEAQAKALAAGL